MKISPETKKYLIFGGALIAAIVLGIIVYKKVQMGSEANQAASDQSTQDELAYLESMIGEDPYEQSGGTSDAITLPSAPAQTSLTDELQAIEQAFGLNTSSSSSSTTSSSSTGSSSTGAVTAVGPAPVVRAPGVGSGSDAIVAGSNGNLTASELSMLDEELPQLREEGLTIA